MADIQLKNPHMGNEVLIGLAALAGLYFYSLRRAAANLVFFPGNISGFEFQGAIPVIYADLIVQNTNNTSFEVLSIAASVTSNGTQVGNVSNFTPLTIPGNSQAVIPLKLMLHPLELVNNIIGIITGGSGTGELKIDGSLNANGIQAPISLTYKLGL